VAEPFASIPFFDQRKVIGLLDRVANMDERARVANDQILMMLTSAVPAGAISARRVNPVDLRAVFAGDRFRLYYLPMGAISCRRRWTIGADACMWARLFVMLLALTGVAYAKTAPLEHVRLQWRPTSDLRLGAQEMSKCRFSSRSSRTVRDNKEAIARIARTINRSLSLLPTTSAAS